MSQEASAASAAEGNSPGEESAPAEKRVGWAELLFDLVFVLAVTQVSTLLHHDHTVAGLLQALIVFVPIYWSWVGIAVFGNSHDMSGAGVRVILFCVALTGLFMALAVPQAYAGRGVFFGASYFAARVLLAGMWGSGVLVQSRRPALNPISLGLVITGPLMVLGGFAHAGLRELLWGCAAFLDLASPTIFRRRMRSSRFDAGHLTERFGLFLIIAIGESVVAIGAPAASSEHLTISVVAAVTVAFVLACGLWWVYFQFAADAMKHALMTAEIQLDVTRHVLSYAHLAFIGAVISVAVGLNAAVTHPDDVLDRPTAGLLFGGCAVYLATYGYTRWMMFRLVSSTRLIAAVVVAGVQPVAWFVPALAALALVAGVLIMLNIYEYLKVTRSGWQAALRRRVAAGSN